MQRMLTRDDIHSIKIGDVVIPRIFSYHIGNGEFVPDNKDRVVYLLESKEHRVNDISRHNFTIRVEDDIVYYRIERFAVEEEGPLTEAELSSALKFDESILDKLNLVNFRTKS